MPGELRVLGLDPGSAATGYGVVARREGGELELVAAGVIRPGRGLGQAGRLKVIYERLAEVIARYRPMEMAVEGVFSARNARSALVLGQARGVGVLAGAVAGLEVFEYPPAQVKKALAGTGRATKQQVRMMVGHFLGSRPSWPLDASDALALAITHIHSRTLAPRGLR